MSHSWLVIESPLRDKLVDHFAAKLAELLETSGVVERQLVVIQPE